MSGSPIFEENNDEEVIGMLIGSVHQNNYKIALGSFLFENLVTNMIAAYKFIKKFIKTVLYYLK